VSAWLTPGFVLSSVVVFLLFLLGGEVRRRIDDRVLAGCRHPLEPVLLVLLVPERQVLVDLLRDESGELHGVPLLAVLLELDPRADGDFSDAVVRSRLGLESLAVVAEELELDDARADRLRPHLVDAAAVEPREAIPHGVAHQLQAHDVEVVQDVDGLPAEQLSVDEDVHEHEVDGGLAHEHREGLRLQVAFPVPLEVDARRDLRALVVVRVDEMCSAAIDGAVRGVLDAFREHRLDPVLTLLEEIADDLVSEPFHVHCLSLLNSIFLSTRS
jgi:hypothetical protein